MMRAYGDEAPRIQRLQGCILYPHDIRVEVLTDADGAERNAYSWVVLRVEDRGQPIDNTFAARHYAELRARLYPPWPEQLDKIYHDGVEAWKADMIDPVKSAFPKP